MTPPALAIQATLDRIRKRSKASVVAELAATIQHARNDGCSWDEIARAITDNGVPITGGVLRTSMFRLAARAARLVTALPATPAPHVERAPIPSTPATTTPVLQQHPYEIVDAFARSTPDLNALTRRYMATRTKGES
jgi:hypothetical protein